MTEVGYRTAAEVGAAVAALRRRAGLEQMDVALRLGIDMGSVEQIERGERDLGAWELYVLAELLKVEPGLIMGRDEPAAALLRATGAGGTAVDEALASFEVVVREVLGARALEDLVGGGDPVTAAEEPAGAERARLGLDETSPIADLVALLERDGGVQVALCQLGEHGVAGMYQTREGVPIVMVNSSTHPVRARFTLAHEYGHHRLGHAIAVDRAIDPWSRDRREVDANRFAAELLLPRTGLPGWRPRAGRSPRVDLETLVRLANHYGVSCEVALHQLERARRVRGAAARQLQDRIDSGEHRDLAWRLGLPELDDTLARDRRLRVRMPARTRRAVLRALERDLIDAEGAAERLHVDRLEIQRMRRLEPALD